MKKQERRAAVRYRAPTAYANKERIKGDADILGKVKSVRSEKPSAPESFKNVMPESHNKNEQSSDFHAKPELWLCRELTCFDLHPVFLEKDVLAEREHYEKQIAFWKRQQQLSADYGTAQNDALNKEIKKAEAAEKKAKDFEDAAGAMSAELTEFGERAEKAEARVEKMQKELLEIANDTFFSWPCECDKMINATCEGCEREAYYRKKLEALAGEKTK